MGANAQTSVPAFTAGQVLTATQVTQINTGIPVFADTTARDAAFGGAGEKVLAQGQMCYLESTDKVQFYNGSSWANIGGVTNVDEFTASGTWTVPAGVTYAIAHIRAGGGGAGSTATAGGTSSVAFSGGTASATGGNAADYIILTQGTAGQANSGIGAFGFNSGGDPGKAADGAYIVHGASVTPAASITVTVGAGGTGTRAGGSGYVWIEYLV
jgi:hypothetical protein